MHIEIKFVKVLFYLSTCTTCKRIIDQWNLPDEVEKIDLKKTPITPIQLDYLRSLVSNYRELLNSRSLILRKRNIRANELSETQIRELILEHYALLRRPILIYDENIFVGNNPGIVTEATKFINEK